MYKIFQLYQYLTIPSRLCYRPPRREQRLETAVTSQRVIPWTIFYQGVLSHQDLRHPNQSYSSIPLGIRKPNLELRFCWRAGLSNPLPCADGPGNLCPLLICLCPMLKTPRPIVSYNACVLIFEETFMFFFFSSMMSEKIHLHIFYKKKYFFSDRPIDLNNLIHYVCKCIVPEKGQFSKLAY